MKLYIDTSSSEKIVVDLDGERVELPARDKRAQVLLEVIAKTLSKKGKTLKDIKGIEVKTGPGSFTGLRVGTAVANALAWSLGIPVNGQNLVYNLKY